MDLSEASKWKPAIPAWQKLARAHPQFQISGTAWSWQHFRRMWQAELLASGACIRTGSRVWLAHETKFPAVALAILLRQKIPGISKSKLRELRPEAAA